MLLQPQKIWLQLVLGEWGGGRKIFKKTKVVVVSEYKYL